MNSQRNFRLLSGISVLCFLIFLPPAAAQDGSAATSTADSTDLDSARKIAEAAYRAAEEASQHAAREYRAEAAQKSPDVKALAELKQKLNSAVKAAFEAQMKLQQVRFQIAQRDLAGVQARHKRRESLASKIIERRVADLMNGEDLEWPQMTKSDKTTGTDRSNDRSRNASPTTEMRVSDAGIQPPSKESASSPVPKFATPQELIDHVETFFSDDNEASVEHYVELLTDDEVKRFSGFLLRTHSTLKAVAGLMATFGSSDPDGDNAEVMSLTTALGLNIEKHRLSNPRAAAESAYQQISEGFNVLQLFSPSPPKPAIDADVYSNLLRTASGVLKDPKAFLRDAMSEMKALAKNSEKKDDVAAKPKEPAEWQVTVVGDTATVVNIAVESDESSPLGMAQTMELVKVGDTWKISSIIPDRVIIDMQQGMTATSSTSNPSDNSDGEPQPPVSRSYQESVEHIVGANAAVAKSDIRAYSELSDSNVTIALGNSDEKKTSALGKSSVVGKYLNRHLKNGEMITAEMLIEKPTTEQIVDFWLSEAAAGREVFESIEALVLKYPKNFGLAKTYPFSSSLSAKPFNKTLPEWTDAFLQSLTQRLMLTGPNNWTMEHVLQLRSAGEVIQHHTRSQPHDLDELGKLVAEFVVLNTSMGTANADPEVRNAAHSQWLLGQLIRIKGSLPKQILDWTSTDSVVVAKLDLLKQMAVNHADDRWIRQERVRLFGLIEDAPVAAFKILLTSGPCATGEDLEPWIYAMSSEDACDAKQHNSGVFAPPVDPVLLIAAADLFTQEDLPTYNNLTLLFQSQRNSSVPGGLMFCHTTHILESELFYRDSVLESLVNIYRKSTAEMLKMNIAKLAPSVPAMAAKDSTPETNATPSK